MTDLQFDADGNDGRAAASVARPSNRPPTLELELALALADIVPGTRVAVPSGASRPAQKSRPPGRGVS